MLYNHAVRKTIRTRREWDVDTMVSYGVITRGGIRYTSPNCSRARLSRAVQLPATASGAMATIDYVHTQMVSQRSRILDNCTHSSQNPHLWGSRSNQIVAQKMTCKYSWLPQLLSTYSNSFRVQSPLYNLYAWKFETIFVQRLFTTGLCLGDWSTPKYAP